MICKVKRFKSLVGIYRYGFKLIVDREFYNNLNWENLGCMQCGGIIRREKYFCPLKKSFVCDLCEKSKIGSDTCDFQNALEQHEHPRIEKIEIIGEEI
jgi:hypothetical protein